MKFLWFTVSELKKKSETEWNGSLSLILITIFNGLVIDRCK